MPISTKTSGKIKFPSDIYFLKKEEKEKKVGRTEPVPCFHIV